MWTSPPSSRRLSSGEVTGLVTRLWWHFTKSNNQLITRYGDPERGKTLLETILSNFPRRTDWSIPGTPRPPGYRRIATLDLQARKMKFLFKKWLVSQGWRLAGYHHIPSAGFRVRARDGGRGGRGALVYFHLRSKSLCNKSVSSTLQTETNAWFDNLSKAN
jgi:hypothetical protein